MTLSSASTLPEVQAAYDDNLDYDVSDSVTKAKAFIIAARMLIRRMAEEVGQGDARVVDRYQKIADELKKAETWWAGNDTTAAAGGSASAVCADLSGYRT